MRVPGVIEGRATSGSRLQFLNGAHGQLTWHIEEAPDLDIQTLAVPVHEVIERLRRTAEVSGKRGISATTLTPELAGFIKSRHHHLRAEIGLTTSLHRIADIADQNQGWRFGKWSGRMSRSPEATRIVIQSYPAGVRAWIKKRGGLTGKLFTSEDGRSGPCVRGASRSANASQRKPALCRKRRFIMRDVPGPPGSRTVP
jgi:hypothetical protein